jgi:23S rRNA (cytidine1920-2'-O)/16S rRNA (cytidine1409-2'-O)-methyltransferase
VSFISLRYILPSLKLLADSQTRLLMMCKPQFEAGRDQTNKGIIKNSAVRREILSDFESWLVQNKFVIIDKADSQVAGTKGNVERFYKLVIKAEP